MKIHTSGPAQAPGRCLEIERDTSVGWTQSEHVRLYLIGPDGNTIWITMDRRGAEELRGRLDDVLRCGP